MMMSGFHGPMGGTEGTGFGPTGGRVPYVGPCGCGCPRTTLTAVNMHNPIVPATRPESSLHGAAP